MCFFVLQFVRKKFSENLQTMLYLILSMNYYQLDTGVIITQNQKDILVEDGKQIIVLPAYEFLLNLKLFLKKY